MRNEFLNTAFNPYPRTFTARAGSLLRNQLAKLPEFGVGTAIQMNGGEHYVILSAKRQPNGGIKLRIRQTVEK